MAKPQTYRAELHRWAEGNYGLVVDEHQGLDPVAVFEVTTTSRSKVATLIIANLLGADTTHAVWRIK